MSFSDHLPRLAAAVGDHLADPATYHRDAGGPAVAVRVILTAPDVSLALTDSGATLPDRVIEVRQSDLPNRPKADDWFLVQGRKFFVLSQPVDRGGDGLFWTVEVETRDGL